MPLLPLSVQEVFVLKLAKYRRSFAEIASVFALNKDRLTEEGLAGATASNSGTISTTGHLGQTNFYFVIDNQLRNNLACQYSTSYIYRGYSDGF